MFLFFVEDFERDLTRQLNYSGNQNARFRLDDDDNQVN